MYARYNQKLSLAKIGKKEQEGKKREIERGKQYIIA